MSTAVCTHGCRSPGILAANRIPTTALAVRPASQATMNEYLCGPALEYRTIPLDIHLERVTGIDAPARAFLMRLAARGAILHGHSAG